MPAPSSSALAEQLRRLVEPAQAERRLPSISAAAVRAGEVVWAEALGLADVEAGEPATPDHQYRIASITKTFTAVAVLQLRDAGALDLDDSLDRHLDGVPNAPTLRRMLAHLSGLQREVPGRVWETLEFPSREELLAAFAKAEQVLPPGQWWHYSNLAFALLGEVVARASGEPYERYVDERILRPLALDRTTWTPVAPAAKGYFVEPYSDAVRAERIADDRATAAAGALWSTTGDLCRWAAFVADPDPSVLAPGTMEEMLAFHSMADLDAWTVAHGLGFMLFRRGERIFAGHSGAHLGFLANVACDPRTKTGAIVMTNASAGIPIRTFGVELADAVAEAFAAEPEGWRPADAPPADLEGVLGPWWSEGHEYVFRYRDGALEAVRVDVGEVSRFAPDGRDRYRAVAGTERGELLEVVRGDAGEPVRLYFATYPFTRRPEPLGPV